MKRMSLFTFLVAATFLAAGEPADKESLRKKDFERLQGTWAVVRIELDGKPLMDSEEGFPQIRIAGEKIVEIATKKERRAMDVPLTLDPTQKPKAMDMRENGDAYKAIYALADDELKVAFRWDRFKGMRPQAFDTSKDATLVLVILKKMAASK